jgi:ParB family chromosome partitioning protein
MNTTVKTAIPTTFPKDFTPGNVKNAMIGIASGDLWKVPVDQLHILPGLNVRSKNEEYDAHIARLARSIFEEGFYPDKALAVFVGEDGRIMVRDGHSRLEAAKAAIALGAQITTLPCVTAPRGTTMLDITVGLVKSNTGKPLLPIEVAVICKRLVNWGMDTSTIGTRLDYTPAYVNELLGLLEAPAALQALVSAGKVSATNAIKAIKKDGPKEASARLVEAANASKTGKITAKDINPSKEAKEATAATLRAIIRLVCDDPKFHNLKDSVQSKVLAVFET